MNKDTFGRNAIFFNAGYVIDDGRLYTLLEGFDAPAVSAAGIAVRLEWDNAEGVNPRQMVTLGPQDIGPEYPLFPSFCAGLARYVELWGVPTRCWAVTFLSRTWSQE